MNMLDIGVNPRSSYQEISGQAKIELTNDIIDHMANEISGKQLLILNKVLDEVLNKYEVFIDNNIDVNHNYEEVNQSLLELFLKAKKVNGLSQHTIERYTIDLNKFNNYLDVSIHNCEADTVRNYFIYYEKQNGAGKCTLDNVRRVLSSYFNWLQNEGYILKNPMKRVPKIKVPKRQKHPIKPIDIEKLRDTIIMQDTGLKKARDLAMFELLLSSGVRVSELMNMNTKDINFENKSFYVVGKGDKERECYFNEITKLRLQQYLEIRTDDNPALFISITNPHNRLCKHAIERTVREYGKKANIEYGIHPHRFRHTFATTMLQRGMPIEEVQKLLGHEDMKTTLIYAEVAQADVKHSHQKYS